MKRLTLQASGSVKSAATGKKVRITAYNGGVMRIAGVQTIIDLAGLELPDSIPLLADHLNELAGIVGSGKPKVERGKLIVEGKLGNSEAGRQVADLLADGVELQASVGVHVMASRYIRPGESITVNARTIEADEEIQLVTAGKLVEVSFTPIGADNETSVQIAASRRSIGDRPMDFHEWLKARGFDPADLTDDQRDTLLAAFKGQSRGGRQTALQARREREERHQRINDLVDDGARQYPDLSAEIEAAGRVAVAEDWSPERLELELLRASAPRVDNRIGRGGRGRGHGIDNERLLTAALLLHSGQKTLAEKAMGERVCQAAADLGCGSLYDVALAALRLEGKPTDGGRDRVIKAAFSTSSLPVALGSSIDKTLSSAYMAAPASWRSWVQPRPVSNFREHSGIRPFAKGSELAELAPGGELKHGSLAEETATHRASTRGRLISISRADIINDDLGALAELPKELGRQAARSVADAIYAALLGNDASFFSEANGNFLEGADTALSITSLTAALKAFRMQADADGRPIDVAASVLLVSPENEFTARSILNSTSLDRAASSEDMAPQGNPIAGLNLKLEVETRLSAAGFHANASGTAWYVLADAANIPCAVLSVLNGRMEPVIEIADMAFDRLGVSYRVYHDFGADLFDPRGGLLVTGVASE